MARDRIDKDELRHDPVQEWLFHTVDYIHKQRIWFGVGSGIILALVIAIFGYVAYNQSVKSQAAQAFNAAEAIYLDANSDADQNLNDAEKAFGEFASARENTNLMPFAQMYLAAIALDRGNAAEATKAYEAVIVAPQSSANLRVMAHTGLAKLKEAAGDLDRTKALYEEIEEEGYGDLTALHLGQLAVATGDLEEAHTLLESVSVDYPESLLSPLAQQTLFFIQ